MNLKAVKLVMASVGLATLVSGCGGGGGGSGTGSVSTGAVYYTHAQLAQEFINRVYGDAGIDAKLMKTDTQKSDYVVVYDYDYDSYDAYYLGDWTVGENLNDYLTRVNDRNYYDLAVVGDNLYQDSYTGVTFEETKASTKDLEKVAAVKQEVRVQKSAKNLKASFGLSDDRSREVARLAIQLADAPKASMTDKDYDGFAKELMGASITKVKAAMKKSAEGNSSDMNAIIDTAAQVNGVGPEHMNQIVNGLFN